ncbi:MAG TPA: chloride channel protein [Edaphobacter sp.]|nr:chloride channel protein [Edaphobacter sp.]
MNWRAKPALFLRDLLWAAALGFVSGAACVGVRKFFQLLQWLMTGHAGMLSNAAAALPPWHRVLVPALGALAAMAVTGFAHRYVHPEPFEEYVEAVQLNRGKILFLPTFWRTLSSAFSVATGAAIGREGSMIQFATASTSWVGERFRFSRLPLATQVACGAAAAVSAAYQAPVAGVFFAAEIVMGGLVLSSLPLLLVAALSAHVMGVLLLGRGPIFAVPAHAVIQWNESTMLLLLVPALMGLLGPVYQWLMRSLRWTSRWPLPLLWSGIFVGLLSLKSTLVWGNGDAALIQLTQASPAMGLLGGVLLLRLSSSVFCVGTGTVGGVFTPTVFIGGALGYLMAHFLPGSSVPLLTVLGMGCLLASVTHAPLMASFMAVELTGQWPLLPVLLVANLMAWQLSRRISPHSLYAIATPEPTRSHSPTGVGVKTGV